jgi:hypothetical protein
MYFPYSSSKGLLWDKFTTVAPNVGLVGFWKFGGYHNLHIGDQYSILSKLIFGGEKRGQADNPTFIYFIFLSANLLKKIGWGPNKEKQY